MNIEHEFNCLGYFGFGSGISFHRESAKKMEQRSAYCNGCPQNAACWQIHRAYVQKRFPDLCAHIDAMAKGKNGQQKVMEYIEKNKGGEPYIAVMMGNMEDAMSIATTGKPKDRESETMKYPFPDGDL